MGGRDMSEKSLRWREGEMEGGRDWATVLTLS